ncbi:MAG: cytochrome c [Deltaproteobacteria bacterium]|nr:cytochrome c [Deltaproteobacteria bacterium]
MSRSRARAVVGSVVAVLAALALQGCMRGCSSSEPPVLINFSMFNQPKYKAQAKSDFFYDGKTMRQPVAGTIARGHLHEDPALATGMDAEGQPLATSPVAVDAALLARGADRYGIYCQPCHDERGEGKGVLAERAKVPTANLLAQRVRELPDGAIFDTVTNGKGLMAGYRYPITASDRWAIIAYVRDMQKKNAEMEAAR